MLYNIPNVDRSSKLPAEIDFLLILDWLPTIPIFPSLSHVTPNESEQKIFFCGQFRTSGDIQIGWYYYLILTPNLICTPMCTRMWMSIENLRLHKRVFFRVGWWLSETILKKLCKRSRKFALFWWQLRPLSRHPPVFPGVLSVRAVAARVVGWARPGQVVAGLGWLWRWARGGGGGCGLCRDNSQHESAGWAAINCWWVNIEERRGGETRKQPTLGLTDNMITASQSW